MIRPVPGTANGRTLYGFTLRGIAWIAFEQATVVAAIALSVIALIHGNSARQEIVDSRAKGILISCKEANERHRKAIPQLVALVAASPQKDPAIRHAQEEALGALITRSKSNLQAVPKTAAGRRALAQTEGFINIMAPAYVAGDPKLSLTERERLGCQRRLAQFSTP